MKRIFLAALAAFFLCPAFAGELHLQLHGLSWHAEPQADGSKWNETNPGLGVRYQIDEIWGVQGGAYHNSVSKPTVYGVVDWTPLRHGPLAAGGFAGLATGYPLRSVVPMGGVLVRWQGHRMSTTVRLIPRIRNVTPTTIAFEVGFQL